MIRAQGHTPGSVMFYVRLQSDAEYLFVGDIAYTKSNIEDGVDRARFVRFLMVDPERREAIVNQLRVLHDLSKSEPQLYIVPAHAEELFTEFFANGVLIEGFYGFDGVAYFSMSNRPSIAQIRSNPTVRLSSSKDIFLASAVPFCRSE